MVGYFSFLPYNEKKNISLAQVEQQKWGTPNTLVTVGTGETQKNITFVKGKKELLK
jgi:hypothetical protein